MDLIKVEDNQVLIAEEASQRLKELYMFKAEFDVKMDELRNALLEAMEDNNIKSFENDIFKATYKAPSTRKTIDSKALKDEGLYDDFIIETPVKSSILITFK